MRDFSSTETLLETMHMPPRQSRFDYSANIRHAENKFEAILGTKPQSEPIKKTTKEQAESDEQNPRPSKPPIVCLPSFEHLLDPSAYVSSCMVTFVQNENRLLCLPPPKIPFISPPQGLVSEWIYTVLCAFWERFGPYTEEGSNFSKQKLSSSPVSTLLRQQYRPMCAPLSWLSLPTGNFILAHQLSDIFTHTISLSQPVNPQKYVALSHLRLQVSLREAISSSHSSVMAEALPYLLSPPLTSSPLKDATSKINYKPCRAVGYKFTSSSPIFSLYIAFSDGTFEAWQKCPISYSSTIPSSSSQMGIDNVWRKVGFTFFSESIRWFDFNNNETSLCLISGKRLYHIFCSEIDFSPRAVSFFVTSGFTYPISTPICAAWIDNNQIVVLNYNGSLRFLSVSPSGHWTCTGYINLSLSPSISSPDPPFIPRIELNPLLNMIYVLVSPNSLIALVIPSTSPSDLQIAPTHIRLPMAPKTQLNIYDFTLDKASSAHYFAVMHVDQPHLRIYSHPPIESSKNSSHIYAVLVSTFTSPLADAIPAAMAFAPSQAYSHSLLAVTWSTFSHSAPTRPLPQNTQNDKNHKPNKSMSENTKQTPTSNHLLQTCVYMLPATKSKNDTPQLASSFYTRQDKFLQPQPSQQPPHSNSSYIHNQAPQNYPYNMPHTTSYRQPPPDPFAPQNIPPYDEYSPNQVSQLTFGQPYHLWHQNPPRERIPPKQTNPYSQASNFFSTDTLRE